VKERVAAGSSSSQNEGVRPPKGAKPMAKKKAPGTAAQVAEAAKDVAVKAGELTAKAAKATARAVSEYVVEPAEKAMGIKKPKKAAKSASAVKAAAKSLTKS